MLNSPRKQAVMVWLERAWVRWEGAVTTGPRRGARTDSPLQEAAQELHKRTRKPGLLFQSCFHLAMCLGRLFEFSETQLLHL